jgi:hypothetical protein
MPAKASTKPKPKAKRSKVSLSPSYAASTLVMAIQNWSIDDKLAISSGNLAMA